MRRCHTPRDERRFVSVRERSRVQLAALQDMNVAIGRQQGQLRAEITIPDKVSDCQTAHLEWNFDLFNTRLAISISPTPPVNDLYFVAHRHGQIGKRIVIQLSQSQRGCGARKRESCGSGQYSTLLAFKHEQPWAILAFNRHHQAGSLATAIESARSYRCYCTAEIYLLRGAQSSGAISRHKVKSSAMGG